MSIPVAHIAVAVQTAKKVILYQSQIIKAAAYCKDNCLRYKDKLLEIEIYGCVTKLRPSSNQPGLIGQMSC